MNDLNPISAVTAENPYPYYEYLATERPFYYDDDLQCWVASSPAAVHETLTHADLLVRPATERVPSIVEGTSLATFFSRMVRMTDGPEHPSRKSDVLQMVEHVAIDAVDDAFVEEDDPLQSLMDVFPSRSLAAKLGVPMADIRGVEGHARALARAIAPGATLDDVQRAVPAIDALDRVFSSAYPDEVRRANAMALLVQGYDAMAATIGHALYAAARPGAPPERAIHNTRRFAERDVRIFNASVRAGDSVLMLLVAGERFAFGTGVHACVAARLAASMAEAAVRYAESHFDLATIERLGFAPSRNVRIPILNCARYAPRLQPWSR